MTGMKIMKRIFNAFKNVERRPACEFPRNILLEPTNACNLRCRMCPIYGEDVRRKREVGFIKREVWIKALDEIGSWPVRVNVDIHGAGEPLLHPDFFDIAGHAKNKANITLGFLCNGTLLDQRKARAVVDLGVDWVCFSVDGCEKEVFEYYRKGAVLDIVEDNINYLLAIRKNDRLGISLNMVGHKEADMDLFISKWAGLVDNISISIKRPVNRPEYGRLKLIKPCPLLYQQLVVGWSGKAGLCCEDYWIDYAAGDFPSESLYDIWHGKPLKSARKLHEDGRYERLNLCRVCDTTVFHRYEERVVEKNDRKTLVRKELADINAELAEPLG
jgi:hypothetical protein